MSPSPEDRCERGIEGDEARSEEGRRAEETVLRQLMNWPMDQNPGLATVIIEAMQSGAIEEKVRQRGPIGDTADNQNSDGEAP